MIGCSAKRAADPGDGPSVTAKRTDRAPRFFPPGPKAPKAAEAIRTRDRPVRFDFLLRRARSGAFGFPPTAECIMDREKVKNPYVHADTCPLPVWRASSSIARYSRARQMQAGPTRLRRRIDRVFAISLAACSFPSVSRAAKSLEHTAQAFFADRKIARF